MKFPAKLLSANEEIYLDAKPNWSYLFWPGALLFAAIAGSIALVILWSGAPAYFGWVLLGLSVLAAAYFLVRYIGFLTTTFVVTSQRIVYRTGVLRRTGREIPIGRVQDVTFRQTIIERFVRAGSLTVESAGRSGQDPFPDISRPAEVQALINRVVVLAAGGSQPLQPQPVMVDYPPEPSHPVTDPTPPVVVPVETHNEPEAAAGPPPPDDRTGAGGPVPMSIAQQMQELADLHRHGVITDAEYEHKRRELLDRL